MFFFSKYFYVSELLQMINEIEQKRIKLRLTGNTMKSTFAQDFIDVLNT